MVVLLITVRLVNRQHDVMEHKRGSYCAYQFIEVGGEEGERGGVSLTLDVMNVDCSHVDHEQDEG